MENWISLAKIGSYHFSFRFLHTHNLSKRNFKDLRWLSCIKETTKQNSLARLLLSNSVICLDTLKYSLNLFYINM